MIISVEEAEKLVDFKDWPCEKVRQKLDAIEQTIRSYTNNNFQNRLIRAECAVLAQELYGNVPGLKAGDTIQISKSQFSDGLYEVIEIDGNMIAVDKDLIDESCVLVTKVQYPADVTECCVNLLEWEINNRAKVGIQSETLSRHSVTYFNQDSANQIMGYPASLLGCLRAYKKARF